MEHVALKFNGHNLVSEAASPKMCSGEGIFFISHPVAILGTLDFCVRIDFDVLKTAKKIYFTKNQNDMDKIPRADQPLEHASMGRGGQKRKGC